jgi:hypothetical protein
VDYQASSRFVVRKSDNPDVQGAPYGEQYGSSEEKLLARIRNRFDYCKTYWEDIYRAGDEDMKYVALDPWPAAEKRQREQAVRPMLVLDEINQNVNQVINSVRQNKRAVKVVPRGFGANDKTAELRGDLIREIEYKSNAQSAYICGFENICNRSFGGWTVRRRYVNEKSFDQELWIKRIENPKSSYPDPDCKEADFSDARFWFLLDLCPRREYQSRYPKATIVDFDSDQYKQATNWITQDSVQVAEYWEKTLVPRTLYLIKTAAGPTPMFEDELPKGFDPKGKDKQLILNERETQQVELKQYITNGLEILEENDEPGELIPIVWGNAKELYLDDGSGPKRMWVSLVRGARDAQMMVNYAATAQAEMLGMTPKTPIIAVDGTLVNLDAWQNSNTTPTSVLTYKAWLEGLPQGMTIPPPMRQPYTADLTPHEMVIENSRRAVQASMGIAPLPTNAQKVNDKSGIALQTIDDQEDRGTFHLVDNFEMMLEYNGRVLNDKIPFVYDAEGRTIGLRNAKEEHRTQPVNVKGAPDTHLTVGEHEITISTGPSFQSERQQANEFVKTIVPELEGLQLDPTVKAKLLALLVKTQNIGPMGDEIVELLDPKDQTEQNLAQLQQQLEQSQQMVVGLQTENQKLYAEKQGKVVQSQAMLQGKQMDNEVKLGIAEISSKAQQQSEREAIVTDLFTKLHVHLTKMAHEAALQAVQHQHETTQAQNAAQNAAATQASDQSHQQGMAESAQENAE